MIERNYGDYIQDIYDSVVDIENFIKGMEFEEFSINKKTVNAVTRSLEVIGEAAKKIPETLKKKYDHIPWKRMAGMRDKLIHEYFGVDIEILWEVIKDEIPTLKPAIKLMLDNE